MWDLYITVPFDSSYWWTVLPSYAKLCTEMHDKTNSHKPSIKNKTVLSDTLHVIEKPILM